MRSCNIVDNWSENDSEKMYLVRENDFWPFFGKFIQLRLTQWQWSSDEGSEAHNAFSVAEWTRMLMESTATTEGNEASNEDDRGKANAASVATASTRPLSPDGLQEGNMKEFQERLEKEFKLKEELRTEYLSV